MIYACLLYTSIAASHLPVEMEYQEVEKNEHPIHKQGQPGRAVAVSYTHLDVYKRQVLPPAFDALGAQDIFHKIPLSDVGRRAHEGISPYTL